MGSFRLFAATEPILSGYIESEADVIQVPAYQDMDGIGMYFIGTNQIVDLVVTVIRQRIAGDRMTNMGVIKCVNRQY